MTVMKDGDRFNDDSTYLAYNNSRYYGVPMIRMVIFSPILDADYKVNNVVDTLIIRHLFIRSVNNSMCLYNSDTCSSDKSTLYHIKHQEIWKLTDDEALDMLTEVI